MTRSLRAAFERPHLGWLAWGVLAVAVVASTWAQPGRRRVDNVYHRAVEQWWSSDEALYGSGIHGYLYLPAFPPLFTPFTWPLREATDALWRLAGLALLATGLFRLARLARGPPDPFTVATLLAIGAVWGSTRTGQTNTALAGLFLHATVDLVRGRPWRVAILLTLALVLKPIALAMLLVVGVLFPRVGWRLAVGVLVAVALPFLHPDPAYVARMYASFVEKMREASRPDILYDDLIGLLRTLGIGPSRVEQAFPAIGAALTLGLAWIAVRRFGRAAGSVLLSSVVVTYLMLFNPRTEANSYVMLSPVLGLFAATALGSGRRATGWALAAMTIALACDNVTREIHRATDFWLKALVALVFFGWLAFRILGPARPPFEAEPSPPAAV